MKTQFKTALLAALVAGSTMASATLTSAAAQEPMIGEIRYFGGNFAPRGWAKCDGQLLSISQNTALFSILGTTYGGDGRTTFGLPDARGRSLIHAGTGPGLPTVRLGQKSGTATNTLTVSNLPSHNHGLGANSEGTLHASSGRGNSPAPAGKVLSNDGADRIYRDATADVQMSAQAVSVSGETNNTGGGTAINNYHPYQSATCIIALQGIFPSRS